MNGSSRDYNSEACNQLARQAQVNQYSGQYEHRAAKPALGPSDAADAMRLRAAAIKAHLAQAEALTKELATIERMLAAMEAP